MDMNNPPHPGQIIRHEILEPLGLTVTEAAQTLDVTRPALSNVLNGHSSVSTEMALRIEKAFGPKMEHIMRLQLAYDMAKTRSQEKLIQVKKYQVAHG